MLNLNTCQSDNCACRQAIRYLLNKDYIRSVTVTDGFRGCDGMGLSSGGFFVSLSPTFLFFKLESSVKVETVGTIAAFLSAFPDDCRFCEDCPVSSLGPRLLAIPDLDGKYFGLLYCVYNVFGFCSLVSVPTARSYFVLLLDGNSGDIAASSSRTSDHSPKLSSPGND